MSLSPKKQKFVDAAASVYGEGAVLDSKQIKTVVKDFGLGSVSWWFTHPEHPYKVARGQYKLPTETEIKTGTPSVPLEVLVAEKRAETSVPDTATNLMMTTDIDNMVPDKFEGFVSWGYFKEIKSIIRSKLFYPIFVTGLSGNGKTLNVQEACAELGRECVRVKRNH